MTPDTGGGTRSRCANALRSQRYTPGCPPYGRLVRCRSGDLAMRTLLVVGGGLFGSLAAACARSQGIEVRVFDPGLPGAASPAAAGLFKEGWIGKKFRAYYDIAVPLLDRLFGLRQVTLAQDDGRVEQLFCVPPT